MGHERCCHHGIETGLLVVLSKRDMQGRPEELGLSRLAGGCGEDRLKEELELFGHQGSRTFSAMHQGAGSQDALHRLGDRLVPEGRG